MMPRLHGGCLLAVLLVVPFLALCPGRACAEPKLDLGFEDVTAGKFPLQWVVNTSGGYPFDSVESVVKDPKYVRSGDASVKLVKKIDLQKPDVRGHLYTNAEVPVQKNGRYVFSFWARGEGKIEAMIYCYGPNNYQASFGAQPLDDITAAGQVTDKDWQQFRYEIDLGKLGVNVTSVRLPIMAAGTVYVDDCEWTPAQDKPAPAPAAQAPVAQPQPDAVRVNLLTLPLTTQPPGIDGRFSADKYSVCAAGLVNGASQDLYAYPARFGLSRDADRLYFGMALRLPPTYEIKRNNYTKDGPTLIAAPDVFYLMLRTDDRADASDFEGAYLAVSPDGALYDAWEQIDWAKGFCNREAAFNADWKIATNVREGEWTVELSVPFRDLKIAPRDGANFMLSFGVNLRGGAVSWQAYPNWFDHPQAFGRVQLRDEALGVRMQGLDNLPRGEIQPAFELTNGGRTVGNYDLTYLVSTPRMTGGRVGSAIFDVQLDVRQKDVVRDRSVFYWNRGGKLAAGQKGVEQETGRLATPGGYVVEAEVRADSGPIFYQKLAFRYAPPVVASFTPVPSREEIKVLLSFHGARPEEKGRIRIAFQNSDGAVALDREEAITGDDMTLRVSMAKLMPGQYNVSFSLVGKDGKVAATASEPFKKWATPPWLERRAGIEALDVNWVPDPWTPVTVGTDRVSVWGRQFTLGKGTLLANITSQEQPLLAEGMTVRYEAGGKPYTLEVEMATPTLVGRGRARVEQKGSSAQLDLAVTQEIEFDGMDRFSLRLTPRQPVQVDRLWVEIPFNTFPYSLLTSTSETYWQRGLVSDELFASPREFNVVWLGNDDVGCAFFTENYKGWVVDSSKPRVVLTSDAKARRLKLMVVNVPSRLTEPIAITFGLHPTPFKPRFAGWHDLRVQGGGIEPPPANVSFVGSSLWNSCDSKPSPRNWKVLEDIVSWMHGRQQRTYPYVGTFYISPYDIIRRDTPFDRGQGRFAEDRLLRKKADATRQEEYFYYAEDWNMSPPHVNEAEWETRQEARMAAGTSWTDYFVYGIEEMLKRTDVDGFYLDIANPMYDMNEERGLVSVTKDGKREGSVELFAARDLYKRLYRVFEQQRGVKRRPWMFGHGFAASVPYSPFWDVNFNCEEVKPEKPFEFTKMGLQKSLEGAPMARLVDSEEARSYDAFAFRAHFAEQFGIPNVVLPQYGYQPNLNTDEHSREMLAWTFLHDALVWPAYIQAPPVYKFWSTVEIPFGMGDAVFHPYWHNDVTAEPACVKVSYWSKPAGNDFILAVANWSAEKATAAIRLPDALGQFAQCVDMESGETFSCKDKTLAAPIPPHDLRVFRFQKR